MSKRRKLAVFGPALAAFALLGWLGPTGNCASSDRATGRPGAKPPAADTPPLMICVGRIEAVGGEVDLAAQMPGTLEAVLVKKATRSRPAPSSRWWTRAARKPSSPWPKPGSPASRPAWARRKIAAAVAQREALAADLALAESEAERARKLKAQEVVSDDIFEARRQRVESLKKQMASQQKQIEAMRRGPLPEEVAVARAEVEAARAAFELREVRTPFKGTVLYLYRHTGDQVLLSYPTPIMRLADTNQLPGPHRGE